MTMSGSTPATAVHYDPYDVDFSERRSTNG